MSDFANITIAVIGGAASVVAALIGLAAQLKRPSKGPRFTANTAINAAPSDSQQPALDRLQDARLALERQTSAARANKWVSGFLTFGQYIIGGLLASSFIQQSLSKELVGVLGLLVLLSSLVYQHFRPDIRLRGALGRAIRLRALIRQAEDDLYAMDSHAANAPTVDDFRRRISTVLSEIESSELQDIAVRKDGETKAITGK